MKIVHCPRNDDPLDYARRHTARGGGGLAELLRANAIVVVLLLAFVVMSFVVGPLKPQKKTVSLPQPTPIPTLLVVDSSLLSETPMCKLPAGGIIEEGWTSLIVDGFGEVVKVRCMKNGTLQTETTEEK